MVYMVMSRLSRRAVEPGALILCSAVMKSLPDSRAASGHSAAATAEAAFYQLLGSAGRN